MRVFAGLLAGMMLVFTLLTASGHLHHEFHEGAAGGTHCAICLFTKGQVDLPEATPVFVVGVFLPMGGLILIRTAFASDVISLLPPGRAPPRLASVS